MMVDIILPTYNRREFLPRALECILKQTFADWRLLVVNDGGADVADLVADCNDERIRYYDRPHLGKSAQLNFALELCESKYIAYMDDDDEVFPRHLERLVGAAERFGADFVYSDTWLTVIDPEGKVRERRIENEESVGYLDIRLVNRINHKQILHTRELAQAVGRYDEDMRILIDYDYIKRLAKASAHPFHLRETTGEHFLRMDSRTGAVSSITGLWTRDPDAAGRSLLAFFHKDPEALSMLYTGYQAQRMELEVVKEALGEAKAKIDSRPTAVVRRFLRDFRRKLLTRKPRPLVTTVITTCNHEKYIAKAIESALAQRGSFEHEILISDDASGDMTRKIVADYARRYPDVIRDISPSRNVGVSENYRRCFAAARGDYIAILEGDDYWTSPRKLARQVGFLHRHHACKMVFSKIRVLDEKSGGFILLERQRGLKRELTGEDFLSDPHQNLIANFSSCMFVGETMRNLPDVLFSGCRFNEIALVFHLDRLGPIGHLPDVLSVYRCHEGGVWSSGDAERNRASAIKCREVALAVCARKYCERLMDVVLSLR